MALEATQICRTCLAMEGKLLSIYQTKGFANIGYVSDILTELTNIPPSKYDGFPGNICLECIREINRCYSFKLKCENSYATLTQIFRNTKEPQLKSNRELNSKKDQINTVSKILNQGKITPTSSHFDAVFKNTDIKMNPLQCPVVCLNHQSRKTDKLRYNLRNEPLELGLKNEKICSDFKIINKTDMPTKPSNLNVVNFNNTQNEKSLSYSVEFLNNQDHDGKLDAVENNKRIQLKEELHEEFNSKKKIDYDTKTINQGNISATSYFNSNFKNEDVKTNLLLCLNNQTQNAEQIRNHIQNEKQSEFQEELKVKIEKVDTDLNIIKKINIPATKCYLKKDTCRKISGMVENNKRKEHRLELQEKQPRKEKTNIEEPIITKKNIPETSSNLNLVICKNTEIKINPLPSVVGLINQSQTVGNTKEKESNTCTNFFDKMIERLVFEDEVNSLATSDLESLMSIQKNDSEIKRVKLVKQTEALKESLKTQSIKKSDNANDGTLSIHPTSTGNSENVNCDTQTKELIKTDPTKRRLSQVGFASSPLDEHESKNNDDAPLSKGKQKKTSVQCPKCGKIFTLVSSLYNHMLVHSDERPFCCKYCEKTFRNKATYNLHELRHKKQKPFQCEKCDSSFVCLRELKYHFRVHSGENPFVCKFCSKRFRYANVLRCHIRTHTGEKPYVCAHCPKKYAASSSLITHHAKHTETKLDNKETTDCKYCKRGLDSNNDKDESL